MKIQILQVAPTKNTAIKSLEQEYEKWLQKFCDLSVVTVGASKSDERERCQAEERDRLHEKLDPNAHLVALHEDAAQFTSPELAQWLRKQRDFNGGKVQFLIGGSHGLHSDLLSLAKQKWSFSKLTFTHEMIRVLLKEQLYRGFAILAGKSYHK